MPPTPEEAAKDLEEGQLDFYRELYEEGDMSGAQEFLDSIKAEKAEDAARTPPPIQQPILQQRRTPGLDPDTDVETPSLDALQMDKDVFQAESLIIPGLLDEKQQEVYSAAVERYKAEGFPDEVQLGELYRVQYESDNPPPAGYDALDVSLSLDPEINTYRADQATGS